MSALDIFVILLLVGFIVLLIVLGCTMRPIAEFGFVNPVLVAEQGQDWDAVLLVPLPDGRAGTVTDIGAGVTEEMAVLHTSSPTGLVGIHLNMAMFQPTEQEVAAFEKPGFHVMEAPTDHWVETATGLGATGVPSTGIASSVT